MGNFRYAIGNGIPDRSNIGASAYFPYVYSKTSGGGVTPGIGGIDSYTKLMLHMDGSDLSTTFTDSSLSPKTVTANGNVRIQTSAIGKVGTCNGNAKISTTKYKIGSSSLALDGAGDYVSYADDAGFNFLNGDFTLSAWVNFNSMTSDHALFAQNNDGSTFYRFYIKSNGIMYLSASVSSVIKLEYETGGMTWNTGQWYHVAFVRSGSTMYMFRDGVSQTVFTRTAFQAMNDLTGNATIGQENAGSYLNGYVDEFHLSKGIARYTSGFTPSTTVETPDSYSVLLLHFEGNNNDTTILDDSAGFRPKYGTGMAYFDGVGDYLTLPDSDDWHFTGDLTIDFWLYPTANSSGNRMLFGQAADSFCPIELWWQTDRVIKTYLSFNNTSWVGGTHVIASTAIDLNAWTHVALVRNSSQFTFYLNGAQSGVTYTSTSPFTNSTNLLHIAYDTYKGYMDEFRLSNGIARFTSNFTPSTGAYST